MKTHKNQLFGDGKSTDKVANFKSLAGVQEDTRVLTHSHMLDQSSRMYLTKGSSKKEPH